MGDGAATDLAHAARDALTAVVDQLRSLLAVSRTVPSQSASAADWLQDERSLMDDVVDIIATIRRHPNHPRISRLDATQLEAVADLVAGAQEDLDPVHGRDQVEAIAASVVERTTELLDVVDSLEVPHGEP